MQNEPATAVLDFWQNAGPSSWWKKNAEFDKSIKDQFGKLHQRASQMQLDQWKEQASSCLALVIILDQFSRNLFRNDPKAFAQDPHALEMAKYGVENGFDKLGPKDLTDFFYLPYMHSEELKNQEICVEFIRASGNEMSLKAAIEHRDIIAEFGRFPHRNKVLQRATTAAEQAFLDGGGFAG